jgi:phage shock protein A
MNLLDKLKMLVQSTVSDAVQDLLGEEATTKQPSRIPTTDTEKLLKQADKRLAKLREDLADAVAREKRAEQSWQAAGTNARKLNDEVDALIKADKGGPRSLDDARAKLQQAKVAEKQVNDLERDVQRYEQLSARLRQEMALLEEQLNEVRRRLNQTEEREASVAVAEQNQQAAKEQRKAAEKAEPELTANEEEVAKREDNVEARDELDSSRMADVLKRMREQKKQK